MQISFLQQPTPLVPNTSLTHEVFELYSCSRNRKSNVEISTAPKKSTKSQALSGNKIIGGEGQNRNLADNYGHG